MSADWWRIDGDDLILAIRLTPRSARETLTQTVWRDEKGAAWLQAQVRAVPEKGQANAALVRLVAKALDIPAGVVEVISGDTARLKRLRLSGMGREAYRLVKRISLEDTGR